MYQLILNSLKAKFVGVSENILSRIAHKLTQTATNEEMAKTAVEAYTIQQIIDSYADSRATEAQQTAVKNYEQKHGLKNGEKVIIDNAEMNNGSNLNKDSQPKQAPQNGAGETPAWAKSLIDANKALTDRLNKMEGERTAANRKQQVTKIVESLPEQLRKPYELISYDGLSEEQFSTMIGTISSQVEETSKDLSVKGAIFNPPANKGEQNENGQLTESQQKAIAHREGSVEAGSQPF